MTSPQALWSLPLFRAPYGWWRERNPFVRDTVLALALTLPACVPNLSHIGAQIGDLPRRPENALAVVLVLAQILPPAARSRWPAGTLAIVSGAFALHQMLGFATTFASVGLYLALYSTGAHQVRSRHTLTAAMSAGYVVLAVALHHLGSPQTIVDYSAFYAFLSAFWLVGSAMRKRRAEEAEKRRLAAEVATAAERARIARELHDVVTHHVTAMVVQADAAQFLLSSAPERAGEGLTAVSDTGRRALTDLRYLLGVLEATGEAASADLARTGRAPALGRVGDLVEQTRRTGQPVEFGEHGERLPQSVEVELAAYRVVQEALTNAVKYATGEPTRVLLRYGAQHTEIEVTTDGPVDPAAPRNPGGAGTGAAGGGGGGRGLAGLRTRLRMLDGQLEAGPRPEGGFEVRATIPFQPRQE
ncbi:histidine kinase [Streptomyces sp. NPDC002812]|uniref:sensor histidine kinase n=1 Tax=Streptomyces sp. NPDC002812 TaxID=3154434 RepID=UPI00333495F0